MEVDRKETNSEKIKRIELIEESVTATTYKIQLKNNFYTVTEVEEEIDIGGLVDSWKCYHKFKEIPSLFTNTPSHEVKDFEDLKLFQEGLEQVVASATDFMGLEAFKKLPIYKNFEENFALVTVCLDEIERKIEAVRSTAHSSDGNLEMFQSQVDELNGRVKTLLTHNLVNFGEISGGMRNLVWRPTENVNILNEGLTCKKNVTCGYTIVATLAGWKTGKHRWTVKVGSVGCYDTIGIVEEASIGKIGPLPVGFGCYPGGHRTQDKKGIKFGNNIVEIGKVLEIELDLGQAFEFGYREEGTEEFHRISLAENGLKKGTRVFPAVVLCCNSEYTLMCKK